MQETSDAWSNISEHDLESMAAATKNNVGVI